MGGHFEANLRAEVINKIVSLASESHTGIDRTAAAIIAGELYDSLTNKRVSRANSEVQLTNEIFKSRLDCHIFFALVLQGWPKTKYLPDGSIVNQDSPLSYNQRWVLPEVL